MDIEFVLEVSTLDKLWDSIARGGVEGSLNDYDEFKIDGEGTKMGVVTQVVDALTVVHDRRMLDVFRRRFEWCAVEDFPESNHAHPKAAGDRYQASASFQKFANTLGVRRYDVSTSNREEKWGVAGSRDLFSARDVGQHLKADKLEKDDLVTQVDVDYYIPSFSAYAPHPILIYTMIPDSVAKVTEEGRYYFVNPETMVEHIKGGASYRSGVWDFGSDLVIIPQWFKFTKYAVEKIHQPGTMCRYAVYLAPKCTTYMPYWLFRLSRFVGVNVDDVPLMSRMTRVTQEGEGMVGVFDRGGKQVVSCMLSGMTDGVSVDVSSQEWAALKIIQRANVKTFGAGDVERLLKVKGRKMPGKSQITILQHVIGGTVKPRFEINFQSVGAEDAWECEEGKNMAEVQAEPITEVVAVTQCDSENNEKLCIRERVENIRNEVNPPEKYSKFATEFIQALLRDRRRTGTPVDITYVYQQQDSPVQRARQQKEQKHTWEPNECRAFVKNELSLKVAPNHNISTMRQSHTLGLSRYSYALKNQILKSEEFYSPGKTPREIVEQVQRYYDGCRLNKGEIIETDYSRYDASMSYFLRRVERDVYLAWVSEENEAELRQLLQGEIDLKCRTTRGYKYEQKSSRCSGSPLTTEGNTIVNAYLSFCAYRLAGFDAKKSYSMIGPKYGDDGIDNARGHFSRMAKELGLTIKLLRPGNRVGYLGRIFVDAATSVSTIGNPIKILKRAPISNRLGNPNALADRVNGYLVTDSETPLVGNYLRAIKRLYKLGDRFSEGTMLDHDLKFRVEMGAYPQGTASMADKRELVADLLSILPCECARIEEELDNAKCIADLEKIKLHSPALETGKFDFHLK